MQKLLFLVIGEYKPLIIFNYLEYFILSFWRSFVTRNYYYPRFWRNLKDIFSSLLQQAILCPDEEKYIYPDSVCISLNYNLPYVSRCNQAQTSEKVFLPSEKSYPNILSPIQIFSIGLGPYFSDITKVPSGKQFKVIENRSYDKLTVSFHVSHSLVVSLIHVYVLVKYISQELHIMISTAHKYGKCMKII